MEKYIIRTNQMQNGKWQPAFLPPQGPEIFSEPTEFDIYFDTKEEADKYCLSYLKSNNVADENIKIT